MSEISHFPFVSAELQELGRARANDYQQAEPFPHTCFDDFLPEKVAQGVLDEFPGSSQGQWSKTDIGAEKKLSQTAFENLGPSSQELIGALNSAPFLNFLETLTGIKGLIADHHLEGGGLHCIETGGKLGVHADFNFHTRLNLDRRINALIYLNRDWRDEYGGHLELWDREMTRCVQRLAPLFNRCVVFSTTDYAYHGHPDPLNTPRGVNRKSLALYYYSNGRPASEVSTAHTTLFQSRPGEEPKRTVRENLGQFVPQICRDLRLYLKNNPENLVPPVVRRLFRRSSGKS